jgi:hypothetical protein
MNAHPCHRASGWKSNHCLTEKLAHTGRTCTSPTSLGEALHSSQTATGTELCSLTTCALEGLLP